MARFSPFSFGLVLLLTVAVGCRQGPEAPAAAGTENPAVTTPAEVEPGSVVPPDDGLAAEPGGEPGVPGSPRPEAAYRLSGGSCYVYPGWVVTVRPRAQAPGQDVVVVRREGDGRAQCEAAPAAAAVALTDAAAPDHFFGLRGDLLFVDAGTGPNERTLRLVDLATGQAVLTAPYEEPVLVRDNVLSYTEPVADYTTLEGVVSTGVNCPQAEEWLDTGFAVGVNRVARYDLDARQAQPSDELVCVPLQ